MKIVCFPEGWAHVGVKSSDDWVAMKFLEAPTGASGKIGHNFPPHNFEKNVKII